MCGFAAIVNFKRDISSERHRIENMMSKLLKRGPDEHGYDISKNVLFAHARLTIMDIKKGQQPFIIKHQGKRYVLVYNGMLYNFESIKADLASKGYVFTTNCDSEVVLYAFIEWKEKCLDYFNGIFAFAISYEDKVFVARDPFGVKPLYYSFKMDGECLIASEIKAILSEGSIKPTLTKEAFMSLIAIGPSLDMGTTLYKNICSLKAGEYMIIQGLHHKIKRYYHLQAKPHPDSYENSIKKVRELCAEAIKLQCNSDVGISAMLSGGLDSSIVTLMAAENSNLDTYSLEFEDNSKYFEANLYQPSQDPYYIDLVTKEAQINHQVYTISNNELVANLIEAMEARDMPHMADVDASMLWFCKQIKKHHKVVLTGECADEVFGGYPWFYLSDLYNKDTFPWLNYLNEKINLVNPKFKGLNYYGTRNSIYENATANIEYLEDEDYADQINRKMTHLSIYYFMQTLLSRMDAMASSVGLEARVPFADRNIVEYLYNMPSSYKLKDGKEKSMLRAAFEDILPNEIYSRKKNPFPKTYNPKYVEMVSKLLEEQIYSNQKLTYLFDKNQLLELVRSRGKSFEYPWYGQLMSGPQLIAYLYQLAKWLEIYNIEIGF